ncbi:BamA/OMP85 family outer membrane protein [Compostibacter hankyongensis]
MQARAQQADTTAPAAAPAPGTTTPDTTRPSAYPATPDTSSAVTPSLLLSPPSPVLPAGAAAAADTTGPAAPSPFSLDNPKAYTIAGITLTGAKYLDESLVVAASGLTIGQKITLPGDALGDAIRKLWDQKLFSDVAFLVDKIDGDKIYLDLHVAERPRLANFYFRGASKSQADELKEKSGLIAGRVVTGSTRRDAIYKIRKYFTEKGYRDVDINVTERPNTTQLNSVDLVFDIRRGSKIKVNDINFAGNGNMDPYRLKKKMKGTHEMTRFTLHPIPATSVYGRPAPLSFSEYLKQGGFLSFSSTKRLLDPYVRLKLFSSSKFNEKKYEEDRDKVISYYNSKGYRDVTLDKDTLYTVENGNLNVDIKLTEGRKYYFGNITWKGNTVYPDSVLNQVIGIHRGDIYNLELMQKRLGTVPSQEGGDVSSLYLDYGYLFFRITPVETAIRGDTIDYEMRIIEGPQADIKRVTITGNDKTNEHVVRRELRTVPGEKFSRQEIIRSTREISQLGFFNPEKVQPQPQPNAEDGTVDIGWTVEEKPSDQLQLSAGWGGYYGITGTVGITFNNFSLRNIFTKNAWRPLPSGDGQKLSLQIQSNGKYYSSYNFSFTEPWLGGKKRNPFTVSFFKTRMANATSYTGYGIPLFDNSSYMKTMGISVALGKQLHWPDDFFSLQYQINYQRFKLKDFSDAYLGLPGLTDGIVNNLNLRITLDRNSTDQPQFPRSGSHISLFGQFTPPYSAFNPDKDYAHMTAQENFKFIEYQKYRLTAEWYVPVGKPQGKDNRTFVLKAAIKMGFLGKYNNKVPLSPFERFDVGGDGMSNMTYYYGKDIISQRGYEEYYTSDPRVNPTSAGSPPPGYQGFTIFNKYTLELRYPVSLNPSSTIYALTFFEAGNGYEGFKEYNPFRLRRAAGIGMRFFLPMFGLLGFDYGVGFDRLQQGAGLKDATKFNFMLGFEPD